MELQRRTNCCSCGQEVLAAPGVCTRCGHALIVSSPEGTLSVVVEPIPSLQRREAVAQDLSDWLEVNNRHDLADRLGKSRVMLGSGLSPAAAGALRDALAKRKAPASISEPGESPDWQRGLNHPLAIGMLGMGAVLGVFTMGLGCLAGIGAYLIVAAYARRAAKPAAIEAPLIMEGLEGWQEFEPGFTRLMGRLPEAERETLSTLATSVAEIQADLQSGGVIAYASGGREGRFASSVNAMLAKGLAAGQAVDEGRPGAQDALRRVARAAHEASQRVDDLVEGGRGADPAGLIATLDSALNEAEAVVEEVTVSQEVEVAR
jgi:hypothetical protein